MPPVLIRAEAYKTCVQLAVVCYTLPASGAIVDLARCLTVAIHWALYLRYCRHTGASEPACSYVSIFRSPFHVRICRRRVVIIDFTERLTQLYWNRRSRDRAFTAELRLWLNASARRPPAVNNLL